ncbi:MAG TPA: CoA-transferase [Candidatus Nanoarchaeia archaeon]|nr:CoA-transferase [Candidatus Nanoarchaeia archaeon]
MGKVISLDEFSRQVKEGAKVGIGGFDLHRKPLSLILKLAENTELRDLELFGISLALEADILIGSEKAKRIISSYTGLENFGQCYFFREGVEERRVESIEMSTYATILSLQAGALGIEYLPSKTMLHSDMAKNNCLVKIIESEFSGKKFTAIRVYNPDIALIHAQEADEEGNVRITSPPATKVDEFLARASKKTFVSVEKIIDKVENPTVSGLYTTGIIHLPGGSAPTSLYPQHDVDSIAMELYGQGSREKDLKYCKEVIKNAIERRRED